MSSRRSNPSSTPGLQDHFVRTTPVAYVQAAGDRAALAALRSIERRSDAVKKRIVEHFRKFEDRWTAKEAISIWNRHLALNANHPAPPGIKPEISSNEIMKMAARNVQARANRRLFKVNTIRTRMENATIRNLEPRKLTRAFQRAAPDNNAAPVKRQRRTQ